MPDDARLLAVKTLSDREGDPGPEYGATRAFYLARGFRPAAELDLWGAGQPVPAARPQAGARVGVSAGPDLELRSRQGRTTLAATIVGSGMVFLDSTVVNVALPAIERDLDTDLAGLQWVVTGYLLTLGALLLLGGALGDLRGRRRVFLAGLAVFTASSILCAAAPTLPVLIAARVLQGVGGAMLVPQSLAIVTAAFRQRGSRRRDRRVVGPVGALDRDRSVHRRVPRRRRSRGGGRSC